jgi:hypothetical protein
MGEARARIAATIPAGRMGRPEEFGATCAFVCSAHAGYMTGMNIHLDGGAYPGLVRHAVWISAVRRLAPGRRILRPVAARHGAERFVLLGDVR